MWCRFFFGGFVLIPIFLIVLVDVFGLTLVLPLQAIYAEHLGATPLQATLLVSVFAVCQLFAGPLLGAFSDRIGRKKVLLFSQLGGVLGYLTMALAPSLWFVYLARVIQGVTAGNLSIAQAYIADHSKAEHRSQAFAVIGVAFGLGFFVGPAVTGVLVKHGLSAPIFLAAAMSLLSFFCTVWLLPHTPPTQTPIETALPGGRRLSVFEWRNYRPYWDRPVLRAMLGQFLFYALCFTVFTSGFSLYAERRYVYDGHPFSPREIGYLFAYSGFVGLILQGGLMGRLVRHVGERRLVSLGYLSLCAGFVILAMTGSLFWLGVSTTVAALGNAVLRPTLSSLISQSADPTEQGTVIGLTQSLQSLAQIVTPIVVGLFLQHGWLWQWGTLAAGAAAVGWLLAPWGSWRASSASQAPKNAADRPAQK